MADINGKKTLSKYLTFIASNLIKNAKKYGATYVRYNLLWCDIIT